ncbi:MAG: alpha/beta hydrolase [Clostridia bacterium]|nr:alpha/beta hydrolase [Clostridia bacterium]
MFHAKNGTVLTGEAETDYVRFGRGEKTLILIPGLGDGLKTVRGMALPFALLYRGLAREFTVYSFSRRRELAPHTGTREMAEDLARAMDALGIEKASVVGVSQGGMIAEWLALDHPEKVENLVLTVTLCRQNPTEREVVGRWIGMAERGDFTELMVDTAKRTYSPRRVGRAVTAARLAGKLAKPKSFDRFLIQAEACLSHDAYGALPGISCPTLVVGGEEDRIVTGEASREIAARIPGSVLLTYEGLGHGLYEETKDFWEKAAAFCRDGELRPAPER